MIIDDQLGVIRNNEFLILSKKYFGKAFQNDEKAWNSFQIPTGKNKDG